MNKKIYTPLELREIFHLEFLRWLSKGLEAKYYALKGGVNLRFFFNSPRYSEDMDLDVFYITVERLKSTVMKILEAHSFEDFIKPYGIKEIVSSNIVTAKQTETTQRFKCHLIADNEEDLFTKIEFSRRGLKGQILIQEIPDVTLRAYKLPPILVSHYDIQGAIMQKIDALASRAVIQARDIFDLYILSSQSDIKNMKFIGKDINLKRAYENIFEVSFEQFKDSVLAYLSIEDQNLYQKQNVWDDIRLKVSNFVGELNK